MSDPTDIAGYLQSVDTPPQSSDAENLAATLRSVADQLTEADDAGIRDQIASALANFDSRR